MHICIGIYLDSGGDQLAATLESLSLNSRQPIDIVLMPDGSNSALQKTVDRYPDLPKLATAEPRGAAVCFNKLIAATRADVTIFLEGGVVVGRSWLDYLLASLTADPRNGLAGPSTNRSWNEQGVFPGSGGSLAQVMATSELAIQRFGVSWQTLEPLYSLADFCYAVQRKVIDAIGGVDEAYRAGPCWEMDYNIRARRAGWQGVWAPASFVWRAPPSPRRQREEGRRFEASKRLYQDRFCALRLRGEKTSYEPHCRGDACEHFAPKELIQLYLPLASAPGGGLGQNDRAPGDKKQFSEDPDQTLLLHHPVKRRTAVTIELDPRQAVSRGDPALIRRSAPQLTAQLSVAWTVSQAALITCVMPTRDRPDYVLHSIELFFRQDYPQKELIIVDDDNQDLSGRLPQDPRLQYLLVPVGTSIGAKRNKACELAQGEIIAQWDDDDWYSPNRLSYQAAPLLAGQADITALTAHIFFDLPSWKFWTCSPELHRRLFVRNVHGGTLVFRRNVWEQMARYPNRSLAEDAAFLDQAIRRGARFERLTNKGEFIYVRHGRNSWSFVCGEFLDRTAWRQVPEPESLAADRAFYAAHSPAQTDIRTVKAARPGPAISTPADRGCLPLVSCIMPTADRRAFVPHAIKYFQRQDYPNKELIIIDDGANAIEDLVPRDPCIRYFHLDKKHLVGAKRNLACRQAEGEIILHWDDDDWHASRQIGYQVQNLLESGAQVCGIDLLFFFDLNTWEAWKYHYGYAKRTWLGGSSLCYLRSYWKKHPFQNLNVGEDTHFILSTPQQEMFKLPDPTFHIGIIHQHNVSPKHTNGSFWQSCPVWEVQEIMGVDWSYYWRRECHFLEDRELAGK